MVEFVPVLFSSELGYPLVDETPEVAEELGDRRLLTDLEWDALEVARGGPHRDGVSLASDVQ